MFAARKYEVPGLIMSCSAKIVEIIEPENAMLVLDKCASTLDEEIEKRAVEVVSLKTKGVFNSDAFLHAADASVARVLRSDTLSVGEVDVFQAVNPLERIYLFRKDYTKFIYLFHARIVASISSAKTFTY
jgi:hypothetical protein